MVSSGFITSASAIALSNRSRTTLQSTVRYWAREDTAPTLDTIRLLAEFGAALPAEDIVIFRGHPEHFRWLRDQYIPEYNSQPLEQRVRTAMHIIGNNSKANLIWLALGSDNLTIDMFQFKDPWGHTLLHYLARRFAIATLCRVDNQAGWESLIQQSLKLRIDFHEVNNAGLTSLFLALVQGYNPQKTDAILKRWLQILARSGINLDAFGQAENFLHTNRISKLRESDEAKPLATNPRLVQQSALKSIIRLRYAMSPDDWRIWWVEESDEFAGEFWGCVEREYEDDNLLIPGAWLDSF